MEIILVCQEAGKPHRRVCLPGQNEGNLQKKRKNSKFGALLSQNKRKHLKQSLQTPCIFKHITV
jgi:hypothetical protein